jgi:SAM-dependent methyltransferase
VQTGAEEHSPAFERRDNRLLEYWVADGFIHRDSRVLDVGAGAGHIATAIRRYLTAGGVSCIEPDDATRARLVERGFDAAASLGLCTGGPYTAILLVEVVEHVPDPVALLRQCRALLAPGGRIFLTTPCGGTKRGNHATNAYDTPEHMQFFTEKSLRNACGKAGLVVEGFRTVNAIYPRSEGVAGLADIAKGIVRPMQSALSGARHLICFVH